jgi:hypothetical protein
VAALPAIAIGYCAVSWPSNRRAEFQHLTFAVHPYPRPVYERLVQYKTRTGLHVFIFT